MPIIYPVKANYCATVEPQYIDWEQVDLLVGDKSVLPDEVRGIYQDFALDAIHRIREFKEALPLTEKEVLAKNAHYLKGAARSLGFVDLSNRLGHIEHLHRTPSDREWARLTSQLEKSLASSMAKLEGRFPSFAGSTSMRPMTLHPE